LRPPPNENETNTKQVSLTNENWEKLKFHLLKEYRDEPVESWEMKP
jgi:hypothetical protein